jgi:hypothetical protein
MMNPAGSAMVNAVAAIRQIVQDRAVDRRGYLVTVRKSELVAGKAIQIPIVGP